MTQKHLFTKQKQTRRLREQTCGFKRGKDGEDRLGVRDWHVRTAIFKIGNQQVPTLYSTWNTVQYSTITWMGKEYE